MRLINTTIKYSDIAGSSFSKVKKVVVTPHFIRLIYFDGTKTIIKLDSDCEVNLQMKEEEE